VSVSRYAVAGLEQEPGPYVAGHIQWPSGMSGGPQQWGIGAPGTEP
jgi:hypothetical protein